MTQKIYIKSVLKDTAENLLKNTNVIPMGIMTYEVDTNKIKIGDGKHTFSELSYIVGDVGDAILFNYKGSVNTVADLPTDAEKGDVYNVKDNGANYLFDGNDWDKMSETINLEPYATREEIEGKLSLKADKSDTYTKEEVNSALILKADKTEIPVKVSELENDAGYLTEHQDISGKADKANTYTKAEVDNALGTKANKSDVYTKSNVDALLDLKASTNYIDGEIDKVEESVNSSVEQINTELNKINTNLNSKADKTEIPVIPTNVSAFINDKGYLTEHQDISGKADKTDTYTKAEVDGLIPTVPTNVSAFTNDAGYLTEHQDISGKADKSDTYTKLEVDTALSVKANKSDVYTKSNIDALLELKASSEYVNSEIDKIEESITTNVDKINTNLNLKADKTEIPVVPTNVSAFTNDVGYLTEHQDITGKADKSDTYTKAEVDAKVSSVYRFKGSVETINDLPSESNVEGDVYNVKSLGENYAWVDATNTEEGFWDDIGGDINLEPYLTKEIAINTYETIANVNKKIDDVEKSISSATKEINDTISTEVKELEDSISLKADTASVNNELDKKADKTEIPVKVSELENDKGYLTEHQDISGKADKSDIKNGQLTIQKNGVTIASFTANQDSNVVANIEADIQLNADWEATDGVTQILNKPTNVSAFTNDVGYLTEHQDISGKADKSDTYTKVETDTALSTKANKSDVYTKSNVDALLDLKSDKESTYTKTDTDNLLTAKSDKSDTYTKSEVYTKTEVDNELDNKADKSDTYTKLEVDNELDKKADKSDIPTNVSAFINDKGYLTEHQDISGKADKSDTYTKSEVDAKVSSVYRFKGTVDNDTLLPTEGNTEGDVYNVISSGANYAWVAPVGETAGFWDKLGENIDLTPYLTIAEAQSEYETIENVNLLSAGFNDKFDKIEQSITLNVNSINKTIETEVSQLNTTITTNVGELSNAIELSATNLNKKIDDEVKELDDSISLKADKSDTYTKSEVDGLLEPKASIDYVNGEINKIGKTLSDNVISINNAITTQVGNLNTKIDDEVKELEDSISLKADTASVNNELDKKADKVDIPTKLSELENDKGYLTEHQDISGKADKSDTYTKSEVDNELDKKADKSNTYTKSEVEGLIPTNVSAFTNDAGYLTEHQDISGKADKSDTYTKSEVYTKTEVDNAFYTNKIVDEALSKKANKSDVYTKSNVEELLDLKADKVNTYVKSEIDTELDKKADKSDTYTKSEVEGLIPTNVSAFTNDAGYLTEHQDISGKADKTDIKNGKLTIQKNGVAIATFTANQEGDVTANIEADIQLNSDWNATEGVTQILNKPTNISAFTNDVGYLTEHQDISGKADKSDTYTKLEVDAKVSSVYRFKGSVETYDLLPTEGNVEGDVYNVISSGANYAWVAPTETTAGFWDKLGENIDLTPYLTTENAAKTYATKGEIPTVPTNVSAFTNDAGYLTEHQDISGKADKADTYTKSEVEGLIPTVPTNVGAFTNDAGYLTEIPSEYITDSELSQKGYLTEHQDISGKADKSDTYTKSEVEGLIPTNVSAFINDKGYLTEIPSEYITDSELSQKGYLTEHQDISGKADKSDTYTKSEVEGLIPTIPTNVSAFTNDAGYLTDAIQNVDNITVVYENDVLKAQGVIEQNKNTATFDWVGTSAEHIEQNIEKEHPDWVCFITDDYTSATMYTKAEVDAKIDDLTQQIDELRQIIERLTQS